MQQGSEEDDTYREGGSKLEHILHDKCISNEIAQQVSACNDVVLSSDIGNVEEANIQTPFSLLSPISESAGSGGGSVDQDISDSSTEDSLGWSPRTHWSTLALPDVDDVSMNYVFSYLELYKVGLCWSFLSDSLFIFGGLLYVILATWNHRRYSEPTEEPFPNNYYTVLQILAPAVYLLNSVIDINWAEAAQLRLRNKRGLMKLWNNTRLLELQEPSSNFEKDNETQLDCCLAWNKIRKHAAHRRTIAAALFFGMAATFAMIAAVLRNIFLPFLDRNNLYGDGTMADSLDLPLWGTDISSILEAFSVGAYFISAAISMTGKRNRSWFAPHNPDGGLFCESEILEDLGDLLFMIGSLTDVSLAVLRMQRFSLLSVASSVLWMVDGCLYMCSNIFKVVKLREELGSSIVDLSDDATCTTSVIV
jgi:hypothetical protein